MGFTYKLKFGVKIQQIIFKNLENKESKYGIHNNMCFNME